MDHTDSLARKIEELTQPCYDFPEHDACQRGLMGLIQLYHSLPDQAGADTRQVRRAFVKLLAHISPEQMDAATHQQVAYFLAEQIDRVDFAEYSWQNPNEVVAYCEILYTFKVDDPAIASQIYDHTHHLLTQAMLKFEQRGDIEKLFTLFHLAPTSSGRDDRERNRLRSRVYAYEMRRVQHHRRLLYGYLVIQVLLILVAFPFLFINAENGAIQDRIEAAADVDLPEEGRRYFTYTDGLYWALITAASIGYGDITPRTDVGRVIAATLGVMGVITIGVIAGLILDWISPRAIE